MALYTPWMTKAGAAIGRGMETRAARQQQDQQNKLAGSAYMGDPQALQELMQVNPQLGVQVQQQAQKRADTAKQKQLTQETNFKKEFADISKNIATFPDFESSKQYAEEQMDMLKAKYPIVTQQATQGGIQNYSEDIFNQIKQFEDEEEGGAYIGKGMEAQVSNVLLKGVEDPEFRNTPEYARGWQLANEPKVIRTPTGDILLRPELPAVFKAPGKVKSDAQQIAESKAGAKKDVEMIKGTEKEIKTSADEKLSVGFYGRMMLAEDNIKKLGDFDSASIWEKFRGITNITASPELQQYRQAADDWIRAKLRRESGATIQSSEMQQEYEVYFPQIGDSQAVMDQKKVARAEAEKSMKIASGKAFKETEVIKEAAPKISEADLSVTVEGKIYKFPTLEALNQYKAAAGL